MKVLLLNFLGVMMKQRKRARLGTVPLEVVLPLIGKPNPKGDFRHLIEGAEGVIYTVKTGSHRLQLFKKSRTCVTCGIVGTHFVLEKDHNHLRPHLNLYSHDGILMTKDHIIPRSKGGKDIMSNYQTMCVKCNGQKSDKWEPPGVDPNPSG